jgi:hypothetical protein
LAPPLKVGFRLEKKIDKAGAIGLPEYPLNQNGKNRLICNEARASITKQKIPQIVAVKLK